MCWIYKYYVIFFYFQAAVSALCWLSQFCTLKKNRNRLREYSKNSSIRHIPNSFSCEKPRTVASKFALNSGVHVEFSFGFPFHIFNFMYFCRMNLNIHQNGCRLDCVRLFAQLWSTQFCSRYADFAGLALSSL